MKALEVFRQNDGEVTKAYYEELNRRGPRGELACALLRAQKRSSRAKEYRRGKWRSSAYDVKNWSLEQVCKIIGKHGAATGVTAWGWKQDSIAEASGDPFFWILYVELPQGQVSFHSAARGSGPLYRGEWDKERKSAERIIQFCDSVLSEVIA